MAETETIRGNGSGWRERLAGTTNTVANLAEGQRRAAGNKRRAYENAHGEAREMLGCLDCALAWGYAPDDGVARATLDRLLALCWGLTH